MTDAGLPDAESGAPHRYRPADEALGLLVSYYSLAPALRAALVRRPLRVPLPGAPLLRGVWLLDFAGRSI